MSIPPFRIPPTGINPFSGIGTISLASLLAADRPLTPSKWTASFRQRIKERFDKRLGQLEDRINAVVQGRVVPDIDDLAIGSGSQCTLAILFLDICGFSDRPNWKADEQKEVLALMSLFMSEMIHLVRDFDGHFEKNTGDGLMAYFGEGATTDTESVRPAVEAAAIMHRYNDEFLSPFLDSRNVPRIKFRIGIDVGPVTLARLGVKSANSDYNSRVAIGTIANVANKLMRLIPDGGICVGEHAYNNLPNNWASSCTKCASPTGFIYSLSSQLYPAWVLNYRLADPQF